jgi:hypothetical protein
MAGFTLQVIATNRNHTAMHYFWISTDLLGRRFRIVASNLDAAKRIAAGMYSRARNRPPVLIFNGHGEIVASV